MAEGKLYEEIFYTVSSVRIVRQFQNKTSNSNTIKYVETKKGLVNYFLKNRLRIRPIFNPIIIQMIGLSLLDNWCWYSSLILLACSSSLSFWDCCCCNVFTCWASTSIFSVCNLVFSKAVLSCNSFVSFSCSFYPPL